MNDDSADKGNLRILFTFPSSGQWRLYTVAAQHAIFWASRTFFYLQLVINCSLLHSVTTGASRDCMRKHKKLGTISFACTQIWVLHMLSTQNHTTSIHRCENTHARIDVQYQYIVVVVTVQFSSICAVSDTLIRNMVSICKYVLKRVCFVRCDLQSKCCFCGHIIFFVL